MIGAKAGVPFVWLVGVFVKVTSPVGAEPTAVRMNSVLISFTGEKPVYNTFTATVLPGVTVLLSMVSLKSTTCDTIGIPRNARTVNIPISFRIDAYLFTS